MEIRVTATPVILFVGESPPPGAPPDFSPFDCVSGTRLATIMLGLRDRQTMLDLVPRANIYPRPTGVKGSDDAWDHAAARTLGTGLLCSPGHATATTLVALGRRTAEALGMPDPVRVPSYNWAPPIGATWGWSDGGGRGDGTTLIYAPHPSGASSTLNDATTRAEVRAMLLPEIILGIPALRPWHFRLDDPATLAAVAAAVAPLCPALGAAALVYADGMHRARVARQSSPLLSRLTSLRQPDSANPMAFEAVVSTANCAWDQPMRLTAAALLVDDGGRALARWWGMSSPLKKDGALVSAAKPHAALNKSPSIAAMRATLARYAMAGLA
jgi:hypothetical protein